MFQFKKNDEIVATPNKALVDNNRNSNVVPLLLVDIYQDVIFLLITRDLNTNIPFTQILDVLAML